MVDAHGKAYTPKVTGINEPMPQPQTAQIVYKLFKLVCGPDNTPNLNGPVQTSEMHYHFVNLINNALSMFNKNQNSSLYTSLIWV